MEEDAMKRLALLIKMYKLRGPQFARETPRRQGRVLQWRDWHLQPRYIIHMVCSVPEKSPVRQGKVQQLGDWHLPARYVIHMVCSVPEKYLVATAEFCNEGETGTRDPGRWHTGLQYARIPASHGGLLQYITRRLVHVLGWVIHLVWNLPEGKNVET